MKKAVLIIFSLLFSSSAIYAQTWEFVGLDSLVIKQLYVSGDTIYAGISVRSGVNINSGLYFTSDGGTNWIQLDGVLGSGSCVWMKYIGDGELFLIKGLSEGSLAGKVYRTTNNGLSWNIINIGNSSIRWIDNSPFNKNEVYALTYNPFPAGLFNGLYKSTDGGNTWINISAFPSSSHGSRLAFAFDLIDSMNLYVTVDTQFDEYLYKSTNKGDSWFFVSTPPSWPVIYTDYFIPNRIYLFPESYVSNEGGLSWFLADSGLTDTSYYLSFYQDEETTKSLYNLRRDGLYSSENDTIYWQLVEGTDEFHLDIGSTGFRSGDVGNLINIFVDESRNSLYLGTASGIYKKEFVTSINERTDKKTLGYRMYQNYPNPFNPITTISYRVPETSFITIKVYDVLGNEIATLVDEEQPAGSHSINFNAANLSSGVYIYRIVASNNGRIQFTNSKRMILLK
jgi:hypothetical protein